MSSDSLSICLPAGSIWLELNKKEGEILAFSPYQPKSYHYLNKKNIRVKKIEKNFSEKEAFYFWASKTIHNEFASAKTHDPRANDELHQFHKSLEEAKGHFDDCETTVSYLLRLRHPALEGQTYGERLFSRLKHEGYSFSKSRILEVGAGLGIHTRDFISQMKKESPQGGKPTAYVNLDLASGMLQSQRKENRAFFKRHFFVQGDGVKIPFVDSSFDLVIANEIIADFPVIKALKGKAAKCPVVRKYALNVDDAPPEFLLNTGAITFLEEVWRLLKPGGRAVIIEYGDAWAYPLATRLKGHTEYSIHFGHLIAAAKQLGFKVSYQNLFDFLKCKPSVRVITGNSLILLRSLMKYCNRDLPVAAYTEETLKKEIGALYARVHNLQFERIKKLSVLFKVQEFKVLRLKK